MSFYKALFLITTFAVIMEFGVGVPHSDTFIVIILVMLLIEKTK